ncbi:MAG: hypothetical protein K2K41_08370 [Ruminiclostridium sp.]|nr:hypothetical protein [Ruminiclostridium sp.]
MKQPKITDNIQRVVADVLTQFMFTKNMDEVMKVWDDVYEQYGLCSDPFTDTPCSPKEYSKNKLEYEKQIMIDRYGHCDGLE